ncbi:MAG: proline racemase family protein [Proteobacteria bacterium]|nr:proline racemase family protein [Pseudomonadota bacterium]MBU1581887.1 proline racemase family protein [Pseudomonadota bacterium]MBU2454292.1 proline racemase family protein [Pseudomonadota bacterium]MBU2629013.1 proline racemase family protein [Pseudomonadota bacterium]
MKNFIPSDKYIKIKTIDAHTAGEPFRIIVSGVPEPLGDTILEKRRYATKHLDHTRKILMFEPRGHADMYGCFLTQPVTKGADFGILFIHNEGFSTMCGHGIIAITTVAVETGFVKIKTSGQKIRIDSPAGLVTAMPNMNGDRVESVTFENVPSFAPELDAVVDVPGLGKVTYDLAFGGAFYAFVNARDLGLACTPDYFSQLVENGRRIKNAIMASKKIVHPFEEDLGFLYGTIFVDTPDLENVHSRHCCVFAEGEVDRSPTGTGVSARLAILNERNQLQPGVDIVINSIINTSFTCRIAQQTQVKQYRAIIPKVTGSAYITGVHEFLIDPDDPLKHGFILR